jgi:sugar lactone lactonase YvrE
MKIAHADKILYVANTGNNRIQRFALFSDFITDRILPI